MEAIVVVWLLCGVGAAMVASSKGRSGCGWLILGVVLGPLGLIISAGMSNVAQADAIRKLGEARERDAEQSRASLRACPVCAEQIQRAAIKCRFCGSFVDPVPDPPEPQSNSYHLARFVGRNFSAWWLILILAGAAWLLVTCSH